MKLREFWSLLKEAGVEWWNDNTFRLGASLAYYTVFSLAPVLLIAIGIAGMVFGHEAAQRQITDEVSQTVGPTVGDAIREVVRHAARTGTGLAATILGVVFLLVGATTVFTELQSALNLIWGVEGKTDSGIWALVKNRLLTFAMVLVIAFLLLVSLVIGAALAALGKWMTPEALPGGVYLWWAINWLVSFAFTTLLFAAIFRILPDAHIEWRDVWVGAVVTALLFAVGKALIGLYIGKSSIASGYGAAGSLVVILVWVYYSSQIVLFGAVFTHVHARRVHGQIVALPHARPRVQQQVDKHVVSPPA